MSGEQWGEAVDAAELRAKYGRAKYGAYSLWSHAEIEADVIALCDALEQAVADTRRKVAEEIEATFAAWARNELPRPKVERGEFVNDREWAVAIARGSGNGDSGQEPEACASGTESDRDGRDPTDACQRTQ